MVGLLDFLGMVRGNEVSGTKNELALITLFFKESKSPPCYGGFGFTKPYKINTTFVKC